MTEKPFAPVIFFYSELVVQKFINIITLVTLVCLSLFFVWMDDSKEKGQQPAQPVNPWDPIVADQSTNDDGDIRLEEAWEQAWVSPDKVQGLSEKGRAMRPAVLPNGDSYFSRHSKGIKVPANVERQFVLARISNNYIQVKKLLLDIAESSLPPAVRARAYSGISEAAFRSGKASHAPDRALYARKSLEQLSAGTPQRADALFLLAHVAKEEGRSTDALQYIDEAVKLDEHFLMAHSERVELAASLLANGVLSGEQRLFLALSLLKSLETIVELTSEEKDFLSLANHLARSAHASEVGFAMGYCLYHAGEYKAASSYLHAAAQRQGGDTVTRGMQERSTLMLDRVREHQGASQ